jgi:alpha,alpha-trehalase
MKISININRVFEALLKQEDTDHDKKITKDDKGPKKFTLIDEKTKTQFDIEGTYHLSNLLQELAQCKETNKEIGEINLEHIIENPVDRISRKIKNDYWESLTRTIDKKGLLQIIQDEKTTIEKPTLYVAAIDKMGVNYFTHLAKTATFFELAFLPEDYSQNYIATLNKKPGILALGLQEKKGELQGIPFVVPGGRFNEMYGWDSYFIAMGLLVDGYLEKAIAIAENFKYQIDFYGKILNANRSYYLTRTQPPLYSSLIVAICKQKKPNLDWLQKHLETIIQEYNTVWMVQGNRLTPNGLNRYKSDGIGMPFEVEPGHFDEVLAPYAKKHKLSITDFERKYLDREIIDLDLDLYFVHDRSMRESGHDTTNRLINTCANLNTVDVNSFLYKYEKDIAYLIKTYFNDVFVVNQTKYSSNHWEQKAQERKEKMNTFCWNEKGSIYFDYDYVHQKQHKFESATAFFPLWAGLCSQEQAEKLVTITLPKFIKKGGIAGSTEKSTLAFSDNKTPRQWDYPFGWAPHQILLWDGLLQYQFFDKAQEMIYRWLWLITKNAVDYNGTIPEKFDLETSSHKVFAEYGNVGTKFDYIAKEGFGWVNASYQYGLSILNENLKKKLQELVDPEIIFK